MRVLLRSFWLVVLALRITSEAEENVEALRSVVKGANQFSSPFFQSVVNHNPGNLITSPLGVNIALAMLVYGARGNTEAQFRNVLHLPASDSLTASGYQSLIDNLNSIKHNEVGLAYKFFVKAGLDIKVCFKSITELYFRSSPQSVNFTQSQEAANIINSWVEQNTNNVVTETITLDGSIVFLLVSAVYFKGQWKYRFEPELTEDLSFHTSKVEVKNVPTMYNRGKYKYGDLPDLNAKFVEIPYKNDEFSMVVILPNEIDGLSDVQKKLQNTSLTNILSQGLKKELKLWLPKFKVENMLKLNDVLKEIGLTDAFTTADFSEIADDEDLYISDVIQKAYIEVNDGGSEASTVRSGTFIKLFVINRPFFYYIIKTIKDDKGNDIILPLFCGTVSEPKI